MCKTAIAAKRAYIVCTETLYANRGVLAEVDIFPNLGLYSISVSNRGPINGWATARSIVGDSIVSQAEESLGVLNADRIVAVYEDVGFEKAKGEIAEVLSILESETLKSDTSAEQYV